MTSRPVSPPAASRSASQAQRRSLAAWLATHGRPFAAGRPSATLLRRALGSSRAVLLSGSVASVEGRRLLAAWVRAACTGQPTTVLLPVAAARVGAPPTAPPGVWHELVARTPPDTVVLGYAEDDDPAAALAALRATLPTDANKRLATLRTLLDAIDPSDPTAAGAAIEWTLDWIDLQFAPLVDALGSAGYAALRHGLQCLQESLGAEQQTATRRAELRCANLAFLLEQIAAQTRVIVLGQPHELARTGAAAYGRMLQDVLLDGVALRVWCSALPVGRITARGPARRLGRLLPLAEAQGYLFDADAIAAAPAVLRDDAVLLDDDATATPVQLAEDVDVLCLVPAVTARTGAGQSGASSSRGTRAVSRKVT